jgi:putative tricarboxylic transport membrane protein
MLLGFILGGMLEDNLRRALLIWDGSYDFLWQRPLTATIMMVTLIIILTPVFSALFKRARGKR